MKVRLGIWTTYDLDEVRDDLIKKDPEISADLSNEWILYYLYTTMKDEIQDLAINGDVSDRIRHKVLRAKNVTYITPPKLDISNGRE